MNFTNCEKCGEHTLLLPLHGEKGGPSFCPICAGKWHAEHTRRRKWGRIIIKAMKFYEREGGRWGDFDKLKLAASGILEDFGIDPLGYGNGTRLACGRSGGGRMNLTPKQAHFGV